MSPVTKSRVLIVEDDESCAFAFRVVLEKFYDVEVVGDLRGLVARLVITSPPIDAVVLDLVLPNGKGAENVKRIATVWPSLPIVVVSGHDYSDTDVMLMGADDVLRKPVSGEELTLAVKKSMTRTMFRRARCLVAAIKSDCRDMRDSIKENDSVNKLAALAVASKGKDGTS
jgi:DNA-binding response OmpR family regulator